MPKRRTGAVAVAVGLLACLIVVPLLALGKLPLLLQAWGTIGTIASSVSASLSSSAPPPPSVTSDAGVPRHDGGTVAHRQAGPLSSAQLGAPLVHGPFVSACGAPDDMKIVVNVTVKMGRAVDVAVKTAPPSGAVASCVERAMRDLQWDVSPKTDHVTVTY